EIHDDLAVRVRNAEQPIANVDHRDQIQIGGRVNRLAHLLPHAAAGAQHTYANRLGHCTNPLFLVHRIGEASPQTLEGPGCARPAGQRPLPCTAASKSCSPNGPTTVRHRGWHANSSASTFTWSRLTESTSSSRSSRPSTSP